ncbi:MAG TPA: hypothetical protein DCY48_04110 [Candidatus Magasanikbacteria bacterium]|nr:MAG: hypothetical protein A3I74_00335 [Candidatus Magasanikbacteria bacterium RIFCSPLOWO2_02_FULL_47_16]OGH80101.1 MAG: hypothetical protein A3C10_02895 [Candidatus Magasanikbacteria bacterium RIFCSPHIGHO2_02_FULL_48_18]HAZ28929.1 hypothetical protein [Candidatus Magasanikbacteria bacterium]
MKIAHIVSTYPPYYGGMGNAAFQMAGGLVHLGHDVVVYTPDRYEPKEIRPAHEPSAPVHSKKLKTTIATVQRIAPAFLYGNAAVMPKVKKELDVFDVVHLHYPFFGTANTVRKWKEQNPDKPLVITYHMDTRGTGWKGLFFSYYARYWMPKILDVADGILASSFDFIAASQAASLLRERPSSWKELPFGVDIERFQPREKPQRLFQELAFDPAAPVVLFVGGMDRAHYFKGIMVLLKALFLLKKNNTPVQTIFVGEGDLREEYMLEARGLGLEKDVQFVGAVDDADLPSYYTLADLLVLPSINTGEAFGMVLLEAMASGVPVLASDLPGVRTVAEKGGLTFPPGNVEELAKQMQAYFSDAVDRDEWKKRARFVAETTYAWPRIIQSLDAYYQELVERKTV